MGDVAVFHSEATGLSNTDDRVSWSELGGLGAILTIAAGFYIAFWLWTDWTIEDAMIVGRIARQFARHHILSFNTDQLVSSATSPPFALMVGLLSLLGAAPLVASKTLGVIGTLTVGVYIYGAARPLVRPRGAITAVAVYLLLPNVVAYTVGGMETPVYTASCAIALFGCLQGKGARALGGAAAAAVLRPDGAMVLAVVTASLWFQTRQIRKLAKWLLPALTVVVTCYTAHWMVYGSPLPQSMLAKWDGYRVDPLMNAGHYLSQLYLAQPVALLLTLLALVGIVPAVRRQPACIWLLVWYVLYYMAFVLRAPLFAWYLQPPMFVLAFFAGLTVAIILERATLAVLDVAPRRQMAAINWLPLALVVLLAAGGNAFYARGRQTMATYERTVRAAAGQWIGQHAAPGEVVFTESLGYIGYYNDQPFIDWPGLVTPDAPSRIRGVGRQAGFARIIAAKQPTWLAIRDCEWRDLEPSVKRDYTLVTEFPPPRPVEVKYVIARRTPTPATSTR